MTTTTRSRRARPLPNAPSYKKPAEKHGWRCKVCGYIYEGEELPPDFICPICKKDASFFERI